MPTPPEYEVMIEDVHWAQIEALPHLALKDKATAFLMRYVCHTPRKRLENGDLKELKNEHAGYWQLDLDRRYRLVYTINDEEKRVYVEYIGMHPNWGRNSSQGRRISS